MARSALTRVSMRNIGAHKLRLALTILAVVLGTAFISGSLMFTNMLERTFDSAVDSAFSDVDAIVSAAEDQPGIPKAVRDEINADPAVARTAVQGIQTVVAADADGTAFQTGAGAANIGVYYPDDQVVGTPFEIVGGTAPTEKGQVLINDKAAEKFDIAVGDEIIIVDPQDRHRMTVTGLFTDELDQGSSLSLNIPEPAYLELFTDGETVPALAVDAADGTDAQALVDGLRDRHPELDIKTGQELADEVSKEIRDALSFISYFLIAFGLVGLLVGTFLIANTFSMIVAQRTKEFALLRALGASKRQITRSVVVEAVIVGLLGSALGVLGGAGLVALIRLVMESQDMGLPGAGWGLSADAVAVPIIVGMIVTVFSAWAPARRAGQVQPVEAMRSSETATPQPLKVRTIIGLLLLLAGAGFIALGVNGEDNPTSQRAALVGLAAVTIIIGLFLAGPALSLPIVPVFGRLIGLPFGAVGSLAATNSRRNPRRASATAFALMLGIALVTVIGMLGASMQRSVDDVLESEVSADMVLYGPDMGSFPVPATLPQRVADVDGVGDVVTFTQSPVTVNEKYGYQYGPGGVTDVISGDPSKIFALEMREGTSDLTGGGVILPAALADETGIKVGDTVTVAAPGISPDTVDVPVKGIFTESSFLQKWVVSQESALQVVPDRTLDVRMVGANGDGSVDEDTLRSNLEAAVKEDIVVQVRSPEEVGGEAQQMINQMLYILYALLSLAVVIAILGIINTLTLSVIERRQEIGMLRAVGTQRKQVRTMIILESVQIAVFGAVLGMVTGLALGWAFLTVLADQGLEDIAYPWTMLGIMLASSVVVGVVAALWPAQRGAKTPPLDAIAE